MSLLFVTVVAGAFAGADEPLEGRAVALALREPCPLEPAACGPGEVLPFSDTTPEAQHYGVLLDLLAALPEHGVEPRPQAEEAVHAAYLAVASGAQGDSDVFVRGFLEAFGALGLLEPEDGETRNEHARRALLAFLRWDADAYAFNALPSPAGEYQALVGALAFYRQLAAEGGFVPVPKAVLRARLQKEHAAIPALRARLHAEDALACTPSCQRGVGAVGRDPDPLFGDDVLDALRRARERFQLEPKERGVLDRALLDALNVPVAVRLQTLERALTVVRTSKRHDHRYHVRVNLPEFLLRVVDRGQELSRHAVIVGKPTGAGLVNATPILVSKIRSVIFNPRWVVPERLFRKEIEVEHAEGRPLETDVEAYEAFWAEKGYEVRGRTERSRYLEQPPGPKNPLGKVKLIFENRNSVYLHDTPGKRLFGRARRAYSHGCLRLQDPVGLAEQLLKRDGTWGDVLDAGALEHWRETPVHLISPIPIVVEYQLASAGPDGVRFFWDVYARSKRHAR